MRGTLTIACLVMMAGMMGCADKLREDRSFTLPEGNGVDFKIFELPAQNRQETIQLNVTSTEPVDIFVFLDKDPGAVEDLTNDKRAEIAAGSQRNATTGNLSVKIPAKASPIVLVAVSKPSPKKADIKLKMTN